MAVCGGLCRWICIEYSHHPTHSSLFIFYVYIFVMLGFDYVFWVKNINIMDFEWIIKAMFMLSKQ